LTQRDSIQVKLRAWRARLGHGAYDMRYGGPSTQVNDPRPPNDPKPERS
jgi:hypothetical protein